MMKLKILVVFILMSLFQSSFASELVVEGQILGLVHFDKYYFGKRVLSVKASFRTYNYGWVQDASVNLEETSDHFFGKISMPCTRLITDQARHLNDGGCMPKVGYLLYLEGEAYPISVYGKIHNGMPIPVEFDCSYPSVNFHFDSEDEFQTFDYTSGEFKAALDFWKNIKDTDQTKFYLFSKSYEQERPDEPLDF